MRVFEVMTEIVRTIPPAATVREALDVMRAGKFDHLVVASRSGVLGIVSDRDLIARRDGGSQDGPTVADVMATDVATVTRHDTVRKAANLMSGRTIGCLPVVERGKLVGIVTASDLLRVLGRGLDRPAGARRAFLHYRVPHKKTSRPSGKW